MLFRSNGTSIKQFRKAWERNDNGSLDTIMNDYSENPHYKITDTNEEIEQDVE